jgi:endonuclease YncB( thermonuclease family)
MARRAAKQVEIQRVPRPIDGRAVVIAVLLLGSLGYYAYRYWTATPLAPLNGAAVVIDGDSLEIGKTRIRLEGIDAPELEQTCADPKGQTWACGRSASRAVRAHLQGHDVRCEPKGLDQFKRVLAVCFLSDGSDLNAWIVRQGWALAFGYAQVYRVEQDEAQSAKRGIWAGTFTPPHEWRQQHPR